MRLSEAAGAMHAEYLTLLTRAQGEAVTSAKHARAAAAETRVIRCELAALQACENRDNKVTVRYVHKRVCMCVCLSAAATQQMCAYCVRVLHVCWSV